MQYSFIYQALLEHYLYGDTELDVSSLERHLQTLQGSAARFDKIGLEEEFRVSAPGARPALQRALFPLPVRVTPGWGALPGGHLRGRDSLGAPRALWQPSGGVSHTFCVLSPGNVRRRGRCGLWGPCQEAGACSGVAALHQPALSSLTAETDQCPNHEGEHEDRQPAGQHEEGPSHPDHPV